MQERDWLHFRLASAFLILLIGACQPSPTRLPALLPPEPTLALATVISPSIVHTPTPAAIPTPIPTVVSTLTPTYTVSPLPTGPPTPVRLTETPIPTETSSAPPTTFVETPTPMPTVATPAVTATPRPKPSTSTPASAYRFLPILPAQPDPSHPCPGCPRAPAYIVGHITDAAGHPLVGVRLVCYNEWHRYPVAASKGGGEYDFPIVQADTTWYVVVLDQTDQPISPEAPVTVDLLESCRYMLNWQRVD
jgi:hypothetical protein